MVSVMEFLVRFLDFKFFLDIFFSFVSHFKTIWNTLLNSILDVRSRFEFVVMILKSVSFKKILAKSKDPEICKKGPMFNVNKRSVDLGLLKTNDFSDLLIFIFQLKSCWIDMDIFLVNIISLTSPKRIGTMSFVYVIHGGPFCKFLGLSILQVFSFNKMDFS